MSQIASGRTIASTPRPSQKKLARQPNQSISTAASGMTTSCPADIPPAAIPMARPRRASNQRAAITEPVARPRPPDPMPMSTPVVT